MKATARNSLQIYESCKNALGVESYQHTLFADGFFENTKKRPLNKLILLLILKLGMFVEYRHIIYLFML